MRNLKSQKIAQKQRAFIDFFVKFIYNTGVISSMILDGKGENRW